VLNTHTHIRTHAHTCIHRAFSPHLQPQLITKYNYPEETHQVRSADGYVLALHRIPYAPTERQADDRPAVLLLHGLLGSSADWVIAGPQKGLGKANSKVPSRVHVGRSVCLYRNLDHAQVLRRAYDIKVLD
jgi:pimeloyl-ACP methyl ester carboxylesterase